MAASNEQNFVVRIPAKDEKKRFHIMKFRSGANTDPAKWSQVRMVRENNKKEYANRDEDAPKFGAGSEYGREEREEARRKKYGFASKRYDPDMQPWLMRIGGKKDGKHFRGQREGGVSDNTAYYVFTHSPDGSFEACPVKEWYNFVPRVAYRTLDCEEAEEKFAQRGKILNHWAAMVQKKLKPEEEPQDEDPDDKKANKKKKKSAKELKISDMDDEMGSGNELDTSSDEDETESKKKKKDKNKEADEDGKKKKKKKKKTDVDNEAFEDSDDGENEGMEVDYMSDESSEEDEYDIQGVDQDEGLAKMLDSDEDEEDEEDKEDKDEEEDEEEKSKKESEKNAESSPVEKTDEKSSKAEKRKAMVDKLLNGEPSTKKGRFEGSTSSTPAVSSGIEATFEEDVRRYLARKPMTTTEILRKMAVKKTGLSKEELMPLLVNVLKRINPHKQKVKGIMYLSLKTGK